MLSTTHLLFSGTICALAFGDPIAALIGGAAGLLPDLDTPRSLPGRILAPVSAIVSKWGHRQITHSLIGSGAIALFSAPVLVLGGKWWLVVQLGYLCGWLLDAASKSGVPALYPSPKRLVFPYDPNFRLTTGSPTERLFQGLLVLIAIATLQSIGDGGSLASFRNLLATDQGAIEHYREVGSQRRVFVELEALHKLEARKISGRFEVIGTNATGDRLIVQRGPERYAIGEQLDPKVVRVVEGAIAPVTIAPVHIPEPVPLAEVIQVMGPGAATGQLTSDEPIAIAKDPRRFMPVVAEGQTLTLTCARAEDLKPLAEVWVSGDLVVRK